MRTYALQRLGLLVPTLIGLALLVFLLIHLAVKTTAVDLILANYGVNDPKLAAELRQQFGLSASLPQQYLNWLSQLLHGNLGRSLYSDRTVASDLALRLPTSVELGLGAFCFSLILAVPLGIFSAVRRNSLLDYIARGIAIALYSVPGFWIATLVLVFGSVWFGWAPRLNYEPLWTNPVANLSQMIVPIIILGVAPLGSTLRLVRTAALEVIHEDYVRTAQAKGLPWGPLYYRHVLRNAMLPIVTLVGLQLPGLIAGTVIFEEIFSLPGVGLYFLQGMTRLDYPVIQSVNLVFGSILILSTLVVDLSYAWIDPRIRYA